MPSGDPNGGCERKPRDGVANAIGVAARMVLNDLTGKIGEDLDNFRAHAFNHALHEGGK